MRSVVAIVGLALLLSACGGEDNITSADNKVTDITGALDVYLDVWAKGYRTKKWDIKKTGSVSSVTLSEGQQYLVNYSVTVSYLGYEDSGWGAIGIIDVKNPTSATAVVTDVSLMMDGTSPVSITCPVSFPYDLAAGDKFTCNYTMSLPDNTTRILDAKVTTSGTIAGGQHQRTLNFAYASYNYADLYATVSDDLYGPLGQVCYNQAPVTKTYQMYVGPYEECGKKQVKNTAKLVTNDTGTTLFSVWTVDIDIPCGGGCTLTPGYWKTHSTYGPAPYDSLWASIGEDTTFFLSGDSYYNVLWTSPKGNAYYILAHAYIAAELNQLNGASVPASVATAYAAAKALLQANGPGDVNRDNKAAFISAAQILDDYNNGISGPGHCSE